MSYIIENSSIGKITVDSKDELIRLFNSGYIDVSTPILDTVINLRFKLSDILPSDASNHSHSLFPSEDKPTSTKELNAPTTATKNSKSIIGVSLFFIFVAFCFFLLNEIITLKIGDKLDTNNIGISIGISISLFVVSASLVLFIINRIKSPECLYIFMDKSLIWCNSTI